MKREAVRGDVLFDAGVAGALRDGCFELPAIANWRHSAAQCSRC